MIEKVWEMIASRMQEMEFQVNGAQYEGRGTISPRCIVTQQTIISRRVENWHDVLLVFITVHIRIKHYILGRDRKDWKFSKPMDEVYGYKQSVRPVVTISNTGGDREYSPSGDSSSSGQVDRSD